MPVNPYFNHSTFVTEQNLVDDLIVESIKIYGHSCYYIPAESANLDRLFGEDTLSHYDTAYEIEVYLKSNLHFGGAGDTLSKFGLVIEDDATFLVSVTRFATELGAIMVRPRENDLLWIQMQPTKRFIFEIKFVEDKEQLFQLGQLYTYELQCELMNYSHERIQTAVPEINEATVEAYTVELVFSSGGNGTFVPGETVYQGHVFTEAVATGTVFQWTANTHTLQVQNITGEFIDSLPVHGITSNALYTPVAGVVTTEPMQDALSDNEALTATAPAIIEPITNPRYNG